MLAAFELSDFGSTGGRCVGEVCVVVVVVVVGERCWVSGLLAASLKYGVRIHSPGPSFSLAYAYLDYDLHDCSFPVLFFGRCSISGDVRVARARRTARQCVVDVYSPILFFKPFGMYGRVILHLRVCSSRPDLPPPCTPLFSFLSLRMSAVFVQPVKNYFQGNYCCCRRTDPFIVCVLVRWFLGADSDARIRDLCGICLGEVGAIDPARVGLRLLGGGGGGAGQGGGSSASSGAQVGGAQERQFDQKSQAHRDTETDTGYFLRSP